MPKHFLLFALAYMGLVSVVAYTSYHAQFALDLEEIQP